MPSHLASGSLSRTLAAAVAAVLAVALAAPLAACSRPAPAPTRPAAPTPSAPARPTTETGSASPRPHGGPRSFTRLVSLYLVKGEKLAVVHRTLANPGAPGRDTMSALLEGPTTAEKAAGYRSVIPAGTKLRSLAFENGTATVDVSKSFSAETGLLAAQLRLAQVVFTLTQFPGVSRVVFYLDGKRLDVFTGDGIELTRPQQRSGYEDVVPAVLVESPAFGEEATASVRVTGSANVFEARFTLELTDAEGLIIATKQVQATSGTGSRGTFDTVLRPGAPSREGTGSLIVSYRSAKDGKRVVVDEIPLRVRR